MKIDFQLHSAGYCTADKKHALRKAKSETIKFYATYGILKHPKHGVILFDTGYTTRFYDYTKSLPNSIYAKMTAVYIQDEETALSELARQGIAPEEVKYIILSHFHADHVGGLKDFPNTTFITNQVAYNDIKNRTGIAALKKAYIPDFMPEDFEKRVQLIDLNKGSHQHPTLGQMYDIFDDGTIRLCDLPGHAKGQIGALIQSQHGEILLAADSAWLKENYEEWHLPQPIVRLFFDSWSDFKRSLKKIRSFHAEFPESIILPCHCETSMRDFWEKYQV